MGHSCGDKAECCLFKLRKTLYTYLLHSGNSPRQVENNQARDRVNKGSVANHQEGRGRTGTNKIFSWKMQQDVWPETVLKMNPQEEG